MNLQEKVMNTTKEYDPVAIEGTGLALEFKKTIREEGTNISATPKRGNISAGFINYSTDKKSMSLQLNNLSEEDIEALPEILSTIGECIKELNEA